MPLILLPAVDVVEGRAVRLVQGKAGSETEYGSALDAALGWQRDGADWIHLVDLDAAFGRGSNGPQLARLIRKLDVQVELSGGIRDDEALWDAARKSGVDCVVGKLPWRLEQMLGRRFEGGVACTRRR